MEKKAYLRTMVKSSKHSTLLTYSGTFSNYNPWVDTYSKSQGEVAASPVSPTMFSENVT